MCFQLCAVSVRGLCEAAWPLICPPRPPTDPPAGSDHCVLLDSPVAPSQTCETLETRLKREKKQKERDIHSFIHANKTKFFLLYNGPLNYFFPVLYNMMIWLDKERHISKLTVWITESTDDYTADRTWTLSRERIPHSYFHVHIIMGHSRPHKYNKNSDLNASLRDKSHDD